MDLIEWYELDGLDSFIDSWNGNSFLFVINTLMLMITPF